MFQQHGKSLVETLLMIPTLGLYYIIMEKIMQSSKAEGSSMEPTINNPSSVIVDKFFYKIAKRGLKRGDIIIARSPLKPDMDICKRILYIEGDMIPKENILVPKNHIWIEGDNKENSLDSREHGPLPICLVKGLVLMTFYPFNIYI